MDKKLESEGDILQAVFDGNLTTLAGIRDLRETGISKVEAESLVYESARSGRDRRAAAPVSEYRRDILREESHSDADPGL